MAVTKINQKTISSISKINGVTIGTGTGNAFLLNGSLLVSYIPAGAIVPLRGAGSVPTGWTIFSSADDKFIVGAGAAWSVDDNGVGTGDINLDHGSGGQHGNSNDQYFGSDNSYAGITAEDAHTHTTMTFSSPEPTYQETRLIKADSNVEVVPQDVCVLKHSDSGWTDMTRLDPGADRLFKANTADGTGASISDTVVSNTRTWGDHDGSLGILPGGGGSPANAALALPSHSHSFTADLTFDLYRVAMSAWYDADSEHNIALLSGAIVMYEGAVAPVGWSLCDGTNGTPEMRNYFIELPSDDADAGTVSGDGNVTCTSVTGTDGAHTHTDSGSSCGGCPRGYGRHNGAWGGHTHTMTEDSVWLPPYYALSFIMFTG